MIWGYHLESTGADRWEWMNSTGTTITDEAEFRRRLPTAEARHQYIEEFVGENGEFEDDVVIIFYFDPVTWQWIDE